MGTGAQTRLEDYLGLLSVLALNCMFSGNHGKL